VNCEVQGSNRKKRWIGLTKFGRLNPWLKTGSMRPEMTQKKIQYPEMMIQIRMID
jgi:hypothetical protein